MTTTDRSTVVGVFSDDARSQQAINALRQAGFSDDQISYAGHGTSSGGFLAGLKRFFTGEEYTTGGAYDDLIGMGMPEEDARSYQREYEAGRSIVAVMGGRFMVGVNAENREKAKVAGGEEVDVDIELDTEPREVAVPREKR